MSENINPIELLKEEMDHDDLAIRVNAIHRLKTIVVLVGGDNFKNQILPYLEGSRFESLWYYITQSVRTYQKRRR